MIIFISKNSSKIVLITVIFLILPAGFSACRFDDTSGDENIPDTSINNVYSGNGDEVFFVDTDGAVNLAYTLDLGTQTSDVYFIFTNTGITEQNKPVFEYGSSVQVPSPAGNTCRKYLRTDTSDNGGLYEMQQIQEYNAHFRGEYDSNSKAQDFSVIPEKPQFDIVDDTTEFYGIEDTGVPIQATCRYVVNRSADSNPVVLNIWVADNCWIDGGYKVRLVDQAMVEGLADNFLLSFGEDDIFHWLTAIFGREWGSHSYSNLITPDNNITILLYDIGDDNKTTGGYLGAFYSRDNYITETAQLSNNRIMFYLDAPHFAREEDVSWEITDYWPQQIVSALAHEFQHMIHFYQKAVLRSGVASEVWLNELCSLVSEDILADKLNVTGPRGVAPDDGTPGMPDNTIGRLGMYNYYNDCSVDVWLPYPDSIISYSTAYAYGAYLVRTYGASFLKNLVLNEYPDYRAIEYAVQACGGNSDFGTTLREWAAANLLSDNPTPQNLFLQYNCGDWFSSNLSNIDFFLGSINLYNYYYSYEDLSGPYLYTDPSAIGGFAKLNGSSNTYFYSGAYSGEVQFNIHMDEDVRLTVVIKEL